MITASIQLGNIGIICIICGALLLFWAVSTKIKKLEKPLVDDQQDIIYNQNKDIEKLEEKINVLNKSYKSMELAYHVANDKYIAYEKKVVKLEKAIARKKIKV